MNYPQILHHGGHKGVTGSCHELRVSKDAGVLIDCGMFQGKELGTDLAEDNKSDFDRHEIDFPIDHIKALIVTHAHIDHCGRIPWLLAKGHKGPIFCTEPTALLLPIILEDSFRLTTSQNTRHVELYTRELSSRIVPITYEQWQDVPDCGEGSLRFRLQKAGHILGSAYVQFRIKRIGDDGKPKTTRIILSGDLGAPYAPLLPAPKPPYGADILILESTYGNRLHDERRLRRRKLQALIERAFKNRGALLIPAFALGRTQELLYEIESIIHEQGGKSAAPGLPWEDLEILLDSPLASQITETFRKLKPFWDSEAMLRVSRGRRPLTFDQLTIVETHSDHLNTVKYLIRSGRPCIVIASAGMCTGGRIVNYIKELIGDPATDMLFIGYQADGTAGRAIQKYGPRGGYVILDRKRYPIRAGIHSISGYSAHADQRNLVDFVRRMWKRPEEIHLVHGGAEARRALAEELKKYCQTILNG